ncbi:hypothetical protein EOS_35430 [Caballeronia mineralivorans PML1(12)]|uniref:Uncharacterized protein n=1 Tax=Caballeronia mineralivorans PML1(12) TaxID=908627 RepID=A0A0J1CMB0_9BURK|nr:hypothetical protein EOS_35430 [Caballeronia mineralivorans PML1(12)]
MWLAPFTFGGETQKRPQCIDHAANGETLPSFLAANGKIRIDVVDMNARQRPSKQFIPTQKSFDVTVVKPDGRLAQAALVRRPSAVFVQLRLERDHLRRFMKTTEIA